MVFIAQGCRVATTLSEHKPHKYNPIGVEPASPANPG